MELQELVNAVRAWGEAKGISGPNGKGTLLGQLSKTAEELTETRDAAVKFESNPVWAYTTEWHDLLAELSDGIGDTAITLILAAETAGLRFEDCLAAAYKEIAGRTGRMENGVFKKDA